MRAIAMSQVGGPEVLQEMDLPQPVAGDHDLLVEVRACGLNPVDTKIRKGLRPGLPLPCILGFDVSGVVRSVGRCVEGFAAGDAVYASPSLGKQGACAQMVCVDVRGAAHKPKRLDDIAAAALPLVTLTAWEALHDKARMQPGETVFIQAGGGGVGHIAIQLAKLHGCRVITTASRGESAALCQAAGADVVIDYAQEDFVARVLAETGGVGAPVVFDTVGDATGVKAIDCVAPLGRMVTILPVSGPQVAKLFFKSASLHYEYMGARSRFGIDHEKQGAILRAAANLADRGLLKPHVSKIVDFTAAGLCAAHREMESGHTLGKLVMKVA